MRHVFPREVYIPKGSSKVADRQSDAVAYLYTTERGRFGYAVFFGKQTKLVAHYTSKNEAGRTRHVRELFESRRATVAYKTKIQAERNAYVNDYKVGEILVCSWGYEQTNVDWYEVVGTRGSMVDIRPIAKKYIHGEGFACDAGHCAPLPGEFTGDVISKKAGPSGIKMTSYSSASRAEFTEVAGIKVYRPHYESHYA